jgi:rRNA pseudouridine-1189 N-methylase Emg1 (Nep1/Mra1 family)
MIDVSNHKSTIKPNSKLSNHIGVRRFYIFELFQKLFGSWRSDRSDVVFHVLHTHTDTIVDECKCLGIFVDSDSDFEFCVIA